MDTTQNYLALDHHCKERSNEGSSWRDRRSSAGNRTGPKPPRPRGSRSFQVGKTRRTTDEDTTDNRIYTPASRHRNSSNYSCRSNAEEEQSSVPNRGTGLFLLGGPKFLLTWWPSLESATARTDTATATWPWKIVPHPTVFCMAIPPETTSLGPYGAEPRRIRPSATQRAVIPGQPPERKHKSSSFLHDSAPRGSLWRQ